MPTYQYVCTNPEDKHEFEVVQSFSDPSVTECPQCGSPGRHAVPSAAVAPGRSPERRKAALAPRKVTLARAQR